MIPKFVCTMCGLESIRIYDAGFALDHLCLDMPVSKLVDGLKSTAGSRTQLFHPPLLKIADLQAAANGSLQFFGGHVRVVWPSNRGVL